jgi:hypothetical protein
MLGVVFFISEKHEVSIASGRGLASVLMLSKGGKRSVGEGDAGKKAKTTPDADGKSVSAKSQATRTSKNPFEKSNSKQTQYFVRVVKYSRTGRNGPGPEFLICHWNTRIYRALLVDLQYLIPCKAY